MLATGSFSLDIETDEERATKEGLENVDKTLWIYFTVELVRVASLLHVLIVSIHAALALHWQVLRTLAIPSISAICKSPFWWVDFFAVAPDYLQIVLIAAIPNFSCGPESDNTDCTAEHVIALMSVLRVVRVFKARPARTYSLLLALRPCQGGVHAGDAAAPRFGDSMEGLAHIRTAAAGADHVSLLGCHLLWQSRVLLRKDRSRRRASQFPRRWHGCLVYAGHLLNCRARHATPTVDLQHRLTLARRIQLRRRQPELAHGQGHHVARHHSRRHLHGDAPDHRGKQFLRRLGRQRED